MKWEAETRLRFALTFQGDVDESLGPLQLALLVFYRGEKERAGVSLRQELHIEGEGLQPKQVSPKKKCYWRHVAQKQFLQLVSGDSTFIGILPLNACGG